ncbi:hypothetical protein SBOR_8272 [Sclerotinia borealis F-4128]|uniref:DUF7732 domain-containing protein n=1 Tax=Sclerotinia borealis (strain F-4128) TaxID=1432307 RepID=W9C669_SCLBF|nr:hypothetical protein SBOR_8272 [Sclerotinia borealis F-4128]
MRSHLWTVALLFLSSTPSFAYPQYIPEGELVVRDANANANAEAEGELVVRDANANANAEAEAEAEAEADFTWYSRQNEERDLFKRKGGGGGGGRGGGGGSSSGGKGGGSSSRYANGGSFNSRLETDVGNGARESGAGDGNGIIISLIKRKLRGAFRALSYGSGNGASSNSEKSSSSSSGGKGGVTSSSSSTGGATRAGSGPAPAYGGGRYYGGGATTPYSSGRSSPLGIAPLFLGVGLLSIYPGLWLYGAYSYPYHNPYSFRNHSATNGTNTTAAVETRQESDTTGVEQTRPVTCLCAAYSECGCDDNGNSTFIAELIGDGNYAALNKSLVNVADVNGTTTILINGTLPNGTTASGGTDSAARKTIAEGLGWWVMIAVVFATCFAI